MRYRSFIWPALLILAGLIALLVNLGAISTDRLYHLFLLWPLILVVIGLEVIARRTLHGPAADLAAALIVLLAVVGAVAYVAAAPQSSTSGAFDASAEAAGLQQDSVQIDAAAANITVGSGDLGGNLYQAHIEYTGPRPTVDFDTSTGDVHITQPGVGFYQVERFTLRLQLSSSVHLRSMTINTGASTQDITLGSPSGIVPVEVNGGALTARFHRPSGVAASIDVSGGAVSLDADGKHLRGVGDLGYASSNFSGASDGYRIRVNGGACSVTLDNTG